MVPSHFISLVQMPLTPNGKLNRKALPEPESSMAFFEYAAASEYAAPRNEIEEKLVLIWREILGVERIGVKENFFDLGGHSLKATVLMSRVRKELECVFSLRDVFQYPTIEQLAAQLQKRNGSIYAAIEPIEEQEQYPVSSGQKRLLILDQLEEGALGYNMPGIFTLDGSLDVDRLQGVFQNLIHRHESLRTSFSWVDVTPVQRVHANFPFQLNVIEAEEAQIASEVEAFIRPFDLGQAPLLRAELVSYAPDRHILMLDMHHIISDGVSIQILLDEIAALYQGKELPSLRIQYKDYSAWQEKLFQSDMLQKQEDYWLNTLAGDLQVLQLPTDYPRPSKQYFDGSSLRFVIGRGPTTALRKLASESGATMYMVLLAMYQVLLSKYSGQEDIIVGSPIAGRPHADLQPIVGMFIDTLAIERASGR